MAQKRKQSKTDEQLEIERKKKKEYDGILRKNQTEAEAEKRKENKKINKKLSRNNETKAEAEKRKENDKIRKQTKRIKKSELDRLLNFQNATRYGPIFVCSSCDQRMFKNNVSKLDESVIKKLCDKNIDTYNKVLSNNLNEITIHTSKYEEPEISAYLCSTCKRHLQKGKIPPMSSANGLSFRDLKNDTDLKLSGLENNLISKRILFQKIYQLPRSRMAGCKDRLINIPINDSDVMQTVERLPRTPSEEGLLEIKLKQKLEYNNFHKKKFVDPKKYS